MSNSIRVSRIDIWCITALPHPDHRSPLVTVGIIEMDEAKELLKKLRSKIERIERELDNIGQKAKIREDYLKATELPRGLNIEQVLWAMAENDQPTFRQLLGLIF
jgi:hypothetical protein